MDLPESTLARGVNILEDRQVRDDRGDRRH